MVDLPRRRTAIVDIGSNSVRLVVYDGSARLPAILFNEKVMAGLGRGLAETGRLADDAVASTLAALGRFARLCDALRPDEVLAIATAAVRDADNGHLIVERAAGLGLDVEVVSGEREAQLAGLGVLSGIPDADGVAGDLGGGSLELIRVGGGQVGRRLSLPLGVLRIDAAGDLGARIDAARRDAPWLAEAQGRPFYLVGGSWRALARVSMFQRGDTLPVLHQHVMPPGEAAAMAGTLAGMGKAALKQVPDLSAGRAATLLRGAALLAAIVDRLRPSSLVVSAYGVREGLLFDRLDAVTRAADPLLAAARDEARAVGRFPEHGDLLCEWIAPMFPSDTPADARLRHAACLLVDVAWRANPDFRAERAREAALHGNWVGIDVRGRAMMAAALHAALGGVGPAPVGGLLDAAACDRATAWGLAMRMAQRLSAGVAEPLRRSRMEVAGERLLLRLPPGDVPLYADAVQRRHRRLAEMLSLEPAMAVRD